MPDTPILAGGPLNAKDTREIADKFFRDGFVHIPGILTPGEISELRAKTDEFLNDPGLQARENPDLGDKRYVEMKKDLATGDDLPFILRNSIELDQVFRDMLIREPILSLVEAIVGEDSKFCGQNVIRNLPGLSIDKWHTDGQTYFPLPGEIDRHDRRIRMPVMWLTVQMPLTDVESIEYGPTQYVPGSHYAGRLPNDQETPTFDGDGPVSVFCKAGDIYLHDPMCWHRGSPNTSNRTRYLFQSQYAARWAYTRFNLYNRVPVDDDSLRLSSDKLLNLLGRPRPSRS